MTREELEREIQMMENGDALVDLDAAWEIIRKQRQLLDIVTAEQVVRIDETCSCCGRKFWHAQDMKDGTYAGSPIYGECDAVYCSSRCFMEGEGVGNPKDAEIATLTNQNERQGNLIGEQAQEIATLKAELTLMSEEYAHAEEGLCDEAGGISRTAKQIRKDIHSEVAAHKEQVDG